MSKPYPSLSSEFQELLERWVRAIEGKDLEALKRVFRSSPDVMVFWSNGERTVDPQEATPLRPRDLDRGRRRTRRGTARHRAGPARR